MPQIYRQSDWIIVILISVMWLGIGRANEPDLPEAIETFVENHCYDCHDDSIAKGEFDLFSLSRNLLEPQSLSTWIRVYDRIEKGEMPPPEKAGKLSAEARAELLAILRKQLIEADRSTIKAKGRGPIRRLTRSEYQDNLRDLLGMPLLDIRNKLPEDRTSHGYTKVARLLDMSRVHLDAYLEAAEAALTAAVAPSVKLEQPGKWRFTGTDLFTGLTTFGGTEAMFFIKDGKRHILNSHHYKEMTEEQRLDPKLELGVFRSATWPYFGYPRNFRAPKSGTYQVRFSGRAVRQVQGFRIAPAYEPLPMSFRSRKPSGPDVSGNVQETGGWMDLLPENRDFETTIQIKKGETFEYSFLGLAVPFIRTPTSEGVGKPGRDHNWHGFTMWMAGAGVKGGQAIGATDEFGFAAVQDPYHVSDFHATILRLMGLDHERLSWFHQGLDQRLTGVTREIKLIEKAIA